MKNGSVILKTALITVIATLLFTTACELDNDPVTSDPRDNFTGNWVVNEQSSLYGTNNYTVSIRKDPDNSTQVLIANFYHFGTDFDAWAITTINSITVPQQIVCSHTVQGSGQRDKNKITWTYTVNDGADLDNVTAVFTKQ
jgi:hypothetical protein